MREFKLNLLREIRSGWFDYKADAERYEVIEDVLTYKSRWHVHHRVIFVDKDEDKYYEHLYGEAATETQEDSDGPWAGDYLEDCAEVFPHSMTVTKLLTEEEIEEDNNEAR